MDKTGCSQTMNCSTLLASPIGGQLQERVGVWSENSSNAPVATIRKGVSNRKVLLNIRYGGMYSIQKGNVPGFHTQPSLSIHYSSPYHYHTNPVCVYKT